MDFGLDMGIEALLAGLVVDLFLIGIGYKLYRKFRPKIEEALEDGELSLDEVIDIAEEVIEEVKELKELPSYSAMKKMKKSELMNLATQHEVSIDGTKEDIIKRLMG